MKKTSICMCSIGLIMLTGYGAWCMYKKFMPENAEELKKDMKKAVKEMKEDMM